MIWIARSEKDTTTNGFEGDSCPFSTRHAEFVIPSATWKHVTHRHTPQTALRDSAISQRKATPQVLSAAKDNMAAVPGQLFDSMPIPVCLWFIARDKSGGQPSPQPSPNGKVRSTAEGEGSSGMDFDPATAALFPGHMEETALGHTPKGWEVRSFDANRIQSRTLATLATLRDTLLPMLLSGEITVPMT